MTFVLAMKRKQRHRFREAYLIFVFVYMLKVGFLMTRLILFFNESSTLGSVVQYDFV